MRRWLWVLAMGCNGEPSGSETGLEPSGPLVDAVPAEGAPVVEAYLGGPFTTLPAFSGVADVTGAAQLVRKLDGTAELSLAAAGLAPGVVHTAHVHLWPCAVEAGGHYPIDPSTPDAGEPNELWATLTPDADGTAVSTLAIPTGVRGDALSVVIHDPASSDKLACADLNPARPLGATASGTFAPFAGHEAIDDEISGTATLVTDLNTNLTIDVAGLDESESYACHLHALPCSVLDGGPHYKLDPSVAETLVENEIWPTVTVNPGGTAAATVSAVGHTVREDAQAVVIHRIADDETPKVACADLVREGYVPRETTGAFALLATGAGSTAAGQATLHRRFDGVSVLTVTLTGLEASQSYPVHLHELPCAVLDGGGHYLVDPTIADGEEGNELWDTVVADAQGAATRSVGIQHLVRAEAQSAVLHGADGTRLACADLR